MRDHMAADKGTFLLMMKRFCDYLRPPEYAGLPGAAMGCAE